MVFGGSVSIKWTIVLVVTTFLVATIYERSTGVDHRNYRQLQWQSQPAAHSSATNNRSSFDYGDPYTRMPVLGTTAAFVAANIHQLLGSIDFPIARIIIIWNGMDESVGNALREWQKRMPNLEVIHYPEQIGCAGGWNRVMLAAPDAPYWFIINDDIHFPPGALGNLTKRFADSLNDPADSDVALAHPRVGNWHPPDGIYGWVAFVYFNSRGAGQLGLFDENIYPAYWEDGEFSRRLLVSGCRKEHWDDPTLRAVVLHGDDKGRYVGGDSRHQSTNFAAKHTKVQDKCAMNEQYVVAKWGENNDRHQTPFGVINWPIDTWVFDHRRRRCILESESGEGCGDCTFDLSTVAIDGVLASTYVVVANPFRTKFQPLKKSPVLRGQTIVSSLLPCDEHQMKSNKATLNDGLYRLKFESYASGIGGGNAELISNERQLYCMMNTSWLPSTTIKYPPPMNGYRPFTLIFKMNGDAQWRTRYAWRGLPLLVHRGSQAGDEYTNVYDDDEHVKSIGDKSASSVYKSSIWNMDWNRKMEILVTIQKAGVTVQWVLFRARDVQPVSWWNINNIIASSWTDLSHQSSSNHFTIFGDGKVRDFAMFSVAGQGCDKDSGWLIHSNEIGCPSWEKKGFLYSKLTTSARFDDPNSVDYADNIAIYMR